MSVCRRARKSTRLHSGYSLFRSWRTGKNGSLRGDPWLVKVKLPGTRLRPASAVRSLFADPWRTSTNPRRKISPFETWVILILLEARGGIEPPNKGFADLHVTRVSLEESGEPVCREPHPSGFRPVPALDETQHSNARAELNRRQGAFLAAFEKCGRICDAAELAAIERTTHYWWLKNDPSYKAAFEDSKVLVAQNLMDEAAKRAMAGSDRLLERLLEAHYPERFRSNLAHRLVDKTGNDRPRFDIAECDRLIRAADERDRSGAPDSMGPEAGK
jgi:hypothetical protein